LPSHVAAARFLACPAAVKCHLKKQSTKKNGR